MTLSTDERDRKPVHQDEISEGIDTARLEDRSGSLRAQWARTRITDQVVDEASIQIRDGVATITVYEDAEEEILGFHLPFRVDVTATTAYPRYALLIAFLLQVAVQWDLSSGTDYPVAGDLTLVVNDMFRMPVTGIAVSRPRFDQA